MNVIMIPGLLTPHTNRTYCVAFNCLSKNKVNTSFDVLSVKCRIGANENSGPQHRALRIIAINACAKSACAVVNFSFRNFTPPPPPYICACVFDSTSDVTRYLLCGSAFESSGQCSKTTVL